MANLIERYIYDVTRRLPEKDRIEIAKELESNIYDMLPCEADDKMIENVLYQMGAPALLAEKYRQNPRYLISPAVYDDYIRVLKWIIPLVASLSIVVGMVIELISAIGDSRLTLDFWLVDFWIGSIPLGISAGFQAFFWTTIGFVIVERTNSSYKKSQEWDLDDLPDEVSNWKGEILLHDSIAELALTIVFSVVGILVCSGALPVVISVKSGGTQVINLFSSNFLSVAYPAIILIVCLSILECVLKIRIRRWTPMVCGGVIVNNLISVAIIIYLINRPDLFSSEFSDFLHGFDFDAINRHIPRLAGVNPIIAFSTIVLIVIVIIECANAIYRTLKARK